MLRSRRLHALLLLLALWLGMSGMVRAGEFCSEPPFNGVVDGTIDYTATVPALDPFPTQITIDTDCTFQNFTASNPLTATLNFQTNDPSVYLIIFNNVIFTGNMACANIDHNIWFVNGSDYGSNNNCQDLFLPAEGMEKQNPVGTTSVAIGEEFTYTLTFPYMEAPLGDPSPDQLRDVVLWDDISALATGADLGFVSINAYYLGSGISVTMTPETDPASLCGVWTPTNLCYEPIPVIQPGEQLVVEITAVANDNAAVNLAGTGFINTAQWWFEKDIDVDGDGIFESYLLPGGWGISDPLTIAEPDLVMTKTADPSSLNLGVYTTITLELENNGAADAYNVTVVDRIPDIPGSAGMCDYDPTSDPVNHPITAQVFTTGGVPVTSQLLEGVHYTVSWDGGTCELTLSIINPIVTIGQNELLRITFDSQLDLDSTADPFPLSNVAGATVWYSQDPASAPIYRTYNISTGTLTDGTPGIIDEQDDFTITTTLSGYVFQKTAENLTTGANPTSTAAPGDVIRYQLRLYNLDQTFNDITITDVLDPAYFDLASFSPLLVAWPAGTTHTPPTVGNGGTLTITGFGAPLNSVGTVGTPGGVPDELIFEFDITLLSPLANGTNVPNQATLDATNEVPVPVNIVSDDPSNGIALPYTGGDITYVLIQSPGPPGKTNGQTTATIGEQFTYTITVPQTAVDVPLYDVRILDDLAATGADLSLITATGTLTTGASLAISNTGTATSLVLEDLATGIDIPAGEQAVIVVTVELQNTFNNQAGNTFSNTASYTYNRTDGVVGTQRDGGGATAAAMTILEPNIINVTKTADNTTPTVGSTIRYTIELEAESGANLSDVFDVTLTDTLDLGLVYVGNPTITGVGNNIAAPDITGDGIATPQTLVWGTSSDVPSNIDIVTGDTITIEYDVQVLNSVIAGTTLTNTIVAQWTGIDGAATIERDGSDGIGLLNDYITVPVEETVTTPALAATIDKARTSDTYGALDADVRVGDIVEYTLTISMPEGTLGNIQLVDTLPQGLQYEGIVSINGNTGPPPYTAAAPFVHADITAANVVVVGNAATDPETTVTWNLGDITNIPDNGLNDDFEIVYRALVLDNVFPHPSLTIPLDNSVVLSFDTAAGTTTLPDVTAQITVLQPLLDVAKSAAPTGGDDSIVPGEVIQYTVDITNNGTSPAYDVVLQDTIPDGLRTAGINVTNIYLVSAGPAPGLTLQVPVYVPGTGVATWDFGPATEYTIPANDTLRIVYEVQADVGIASGLTLTNAAVATTWYSFDNDDIPTSATLNGVAEIYGPSNTATTTLYTGSPPTKELLSPLPAAPDATIGEEIVYRITVPGSISSASLYDVVVTDILDANLVYVSATVTGGIGVTNNSTAGQLSIAIDEIPAGQDVEIELHVRILNVASAQGEGANIDNTASYTFAYTPGGTTQPALASTDIVTVNIVEPTVAIAKAVTNTTSPGQPPVAGDVLRYTLTLTASGGVAADDFSDAFDVSVEDTLSLGLLYSGNPTVSGADNTIAAPTTAGDGIAVAQTLNWSLADGNADIDIPEGTAVTVTYDVLVLNTVIAGQTLSNSALARWTGLDDAIANERDGSGAPAHNDYFTAPEVVSLTVPDNTTVIKGIEAETFGALDGNVRIGDVIDYSLTITLQEGLTANVNIVDTLPQGLQFEEMVSINNNTVAPFTPVVPFTHANIALPIVTGDASAGSTTVEWNIGDITNAADADPNNDEFVIIYRVRVLNDAFAMPQAASTLLSNSVDFSYDTIAGTTTQSAISNVTLQQPILAVTKQAAPDGGDTVIDANESITYTVDIVNSGQGPAYDVTLQDIIPVGLRTAGINVTNIYLVSAGPAPGLPLLAPAYDPVSGIATWDFNTVVANEYTIPANDTLRIVYEVQADATLAPNMSMTNEAQVQVYYSLDSDAIPLVGGVTGVPQVYGVTNIAQTTLTTAGPLALDKQNPATTTVQVGDTFTYSITVPATPMPTALNDVIIYDDLSASAADLVLDSFSISNTFGGSFTLSNTGTPTSLELQDLATGIDIPAGGQVTVNITVVVQNTANNNNPAGVLFNNTATYTYNQINDDIATVQPGPGDTTADMQIVGPYSLVMTKTGPAQMNPTIPATFTMDVLNTGTGTAYDITVTDVLPNEDPAPGGMCDTAPNNVTAQIVDPGGIVISSLVQDMDYTVSFLPPACTLSITMTSLTAALPANHRLVITYDAVIDADNPQGTSLINYAGATEWFTGNTDGSGATGEINTYTQTLSLTTEVNPDFEDWHEVITQSPEFNFEKTVSNVTTGQGPVAGLTASPGDVLHYIIRLDNTSVVPLSNFSITDEMDALNASPWFEPGSMTNINVVAPLGADISNIDINGGSNGTGLIDVQNISIAADDGVPGSGNDEVVIEFDIVLAAVIPNNTIVLNQAQMDSVVTGTLVSDDPVSGAADDPTEVLITSVPVLDVQKTVADITNDPASLAAGDSLRYTITVKNVAGEDAVNAILQDSMPANTTYVPSSTTLNGNTVTDPAAGVSALEAGMLINSPDTATPGYLTADPDPLANNTATITFDVVVSPAAVAGLVISNQGFVDASGVGGALMPQEPTDDPGTVTDDDPTLITVNVTGVGTLSGFAWHDADFDDVQDAGEQSLEGWYVDVYFNNALLTTTTVDATGAWQVTGLEPNFVNGADNGIDYDVRFRAPDAVAGSASMGVASSIFTNNQQHIADILFAPGSVTAGLNMPIDPDGVVYDSVTRVAVPGTTLTMVQVVGAVDQPLDASCFNDPNQQGQVTLASGFYKFDINFSHASCPAGVDYVIRIGLPGTHNGFPSVVIPPTTSDATAAYSVPTCSADAVGATTECEAVASELAPPATTPPGPGTTYYLHVNLNDGTVPQDSQLFNNHIPLDPELATAVTITKTSSLLNVKRGDLVPYTITATNSLAGPLPDVNIIDNFPAGFRYVTGSARINGVPTEPVINGQTLTWPNLVLNTNTQYVIKLLLAVGSGVAEGKYVNRALIWDNITSQQASEIATATVRVVPDPTFDCTDVIGKVFDDKNMNGYQDEGEKGIANARVISARGLIMKTDAHGRFHLTCAVVPNQDRGSNFILKVDERSLPSGYRVITENPRVQRATRGKMMKFNFGATIHRVVRLDIADPIFEKNSTKLRMQWKPRLKLLVNELDKGPAILRISYLGDTESSGLVSDRIDAIRQEIMSLIDQQDCCESLTVEVEIFWRRGSPAR